MEQLGVGDAKICWLNPCSASALPASTGPTAVLPSSLTPPVLPPLPRPLLPTGTSTGVIVLIYMEGMDAARLLGVQCTPAFLVDQALFADIQRAKAGERAYRGRRQGGEHALRAPLCCPASPACVHLHLHPPLPS